MSPAWQEKHGSPGRYPGGALPYTIAVHAVFAAGAFEI
jgi:hypothetical protein